ncbi:putative endonuclease-reverse transcriptase [Trichonephila clavipes]|nr:putative endonuclease-reverse transcriptase [Trichonephila clavipes]
MVQVQNDLLDPLRGKNGVRQGDALACLLFTLALEKVVRDSSISTRGNIFNKSIQLLDFADDIDTIARTPTTLRKMDRGEEDQISSSINHIMNFSLLTPSKYNELNGHVMLSERSKTAPIKKKSSMFNQLAHKERASQNLDGLMA